jgi:hypothetical protein
VVGRRTEERDEAWVRRWPEKTPPCLKWPGPTCGRNRGRDSKVAGPGVLEVVHALASPRWVRLGFMGGLDRRGARVQDALDSAGARRRNQRKERSEHRGHPYASNVELSKPLEHTNDFYAALLGPLVGVRPNRRRTRGVPPPCTWAWAKRLKGWPVPHGAEKAALTWLITIARGDTDQSRRVADFLLAWWNSGACGPFDPDESMGRRRRDRSPT